MLKIPLEVTLPIGRIRRAQRVSGKDRNPAKPRNQNSLFQKVHAEYCLMKSPALVLKRNESPCHFKQHVPDRIAVIMLN